MYRRIINILVLSTLFCTSLVLAKLEISEVDRLIKVNRQRVVVNAIITLENPSGPEPETAVTVCEPEFLASQAALWEVSQGHDRKTRKVLKWEFTTPDGCPDEVVCKQFTLDQPLETGQSLNVTYAAVLTHALHPVPAEISPEDNQKVIFDGTLHTILPYPVAKEKTVIDLRVKSDTKDVDFYTKAEPVELKDGKLTYGPFPSVKPFSMEPVKVHFVNNNPFLYATSVVKEVYISHWGAVTFEEKYEMHHAGAKIMGEWSRLEFTANRKYGRAGMREMHAILLPSSENLHFRDEIGNISTSAARLTKEGIIIGLQPRFPLFGGWNTRFQFGWTLPFNKVMKKIKQEETGEVVDSFMAPYGPSIRELVVDLLTIKMYLPEGSSIVKIQFPLEVDGQYTERQYTYLDVLGRPVVVIQKKNYAPEMNSVFGVTYKVSMFGAVEKSAIVLLMFVVLYLLTEVASRLDGDDNDDSGGNGKEKKKKESGEGEKPHVE